MDYAVRVEFFGDTIDKISLIDPLLTTKIEDLESFIFFPAKQFFNNRRKSL